MVLNNKVAVIYGAGGGIGGPVARAFAREGATLFLTGRHRAAVEAVAQDIVSAGGCAEAAEVDALDEKAIDKPLRSVIGKAGRVAISFTAVGFPDATMKGVPLVELGVEQCSLSITSYATSYFLTARLAAQGTEEITLGERTRRSCDQRVHRHPAILVTPAYRQPLPISLTTLGARSARP
jgi:NAD(P)-dependent dehydrogenase (short-subunit alcohol dehydrogenase family)